MRTIALLNQKGGVGKTTTAVNLAACLGEAGHRTLLVDLDPQSNATLACGATPPAGRTIYDVLMGRCPAREALFPVRGNTDILPSSIDLAGAEIELAGTIGRESALRDALQSIDGYAFVLVDCPPSLGLLNVNALVYAREVFIPLQCEFFALQGITHLLRTVDLVKRRLNPELTITGVIPCMVDARTTLSKEVLEEIGKHFGDRLFRARIRKNVRLAEAPSHGKTILDYAPSSHGAEDYRALAREVLGLPSVDESLAGRSPLEEKPAGLETRD